MTFGGQLRAERPTDRSIYSCICRLGQSQLVVVVVVVILLKNDRSHLEANSNRRAPTRRRENRSRQLFAATSRPGSVYSSVGGGFLSRAFPLWSSIARLDDRFLGKTLGRLHPFQEELPVCPAVWLAGWRKGTVRLVGGPCILIDNYRRSPGKQRQQGQQEEEQHQQQQLAASRPKPTSRTTAP